MNTLQDYLDTTKTPISREAEHMLFTMLQADTTPDAHKDSIRAYLVKINKGLVGMVKKRYAGDLVRIRTC